LLVDVGCGFVVDGLVVVGGLVVGGLGSILQIRNKIITIKRNFLEKVIVRVLRSYTRQND
jgi:hypothetical protein